MATPAFKHDPRIPKVGTVLTREYNGKTVKVTVVKDGFRWGGKTFKGISAVASEITGQSRSGYDWFGLKGEPTRKTKSGKPKKKTGPRRGSKFYRVVVEEGPDRQTVIPGTETGGINGHVVHRGDPQGPCLFVDTGGPLDLASKAGYWAALGEPARAQYFAAKALDASALYVTPLPPSRKKTSSGRKPVAAHWAGQLTMGEDGKPKLAKLEQRVFNQLAEPGCSSGLTDEQIEELTGLDHQTASARRRALVLLGLVKDAGERRRTSKGRTATVWTLARPA